MDYDLTAFDALRSARGMMTIREIVNLVDQGNIIFDPFSVLISSDVRIGTGNIIHSCVSLLTSSEGEMSIGDGNTFHPNCSFLAEGAVIKIGCRNQFGEGGFIAKANRKGTHIEISNDGRYLGGASVFGNTKLGDGCQLLGSMNVYNCVLEGGDSWRDGDPDQRGALLKGTGAARGLTLARGQVIAGQGAFNMDDVKSQSFFHPTAGTRT
ncbi:hypothetical protein [Epibacterium ulvae]|uniref:hypothetical protein n=1 Tax=Epibacterium ulvae TaxID=1156985 RepID=UPI002491947C|nr:hypothetical protein [Epibacterium ulvae]